GRRALDEALGQRADRVAGLGHVGGYPAQADQQVVVDDVAVVVDRLEHFQRRLLAEAPDEDDARLVLRLALARPDCGNRALEQRVVFLGGNARAGASQQVRLGTAQLPRLVAADRVELAQQRPVAVVDPEAGTQALVVRRAAGLLLQLAAK